MSAMDLRKFIEKKLVASTSAEVIEVEEGEASDEVLEVADASERSEKIGECREKRDSQEENSLRGNEKDSAGARKRKGTRSESSKHL